MDEKDGQAAGACWLVGEEAVLNREQRRGFAAQIDQKPMVSLHELRLLHVEQYQLRNQTCLTWPMQKRYLIVAKFDACSLQHGSMLA